MACHLKSNSILWYAQSQKNASVSLKHDIPTGPSSNLPNCAIFGGSHNYLISTSLTRVHVWKLKEEKICEEYQSMVKDKVADAEWKYFDVNGHWQQMKNIIMVLDTAEVTCGLSKGPCRHNNRQRHGISTRRVYKKQRELFL